MSIYIYVTFMHITVYTQPTNVLYSRLASTLPDSSDVHKDIKPKEYSDDNALEALLNGE